MNKYKCEDGISTRPSPTQQTPRTDAAMHKTHLLDGDGIVTANFARTLELEVQELKSQNKILHSELSHKLVKVAHGTWEITPGEYEDRITQLKAKLDSKDQLITDLKLSIQVHEEQNQELRKQRDDCNNDAVVRRKLPCEHIRPCDYVAVGETIKRFCMTIPVGNGKTFKFQIPNDWTRCPVCGAKRKPGGDYFCPSNVESSRREL